jgi:hypothetical protein
MLNGFYLIDLFNSKKVPLALIRVEIFFSKLSAKAIKRITILR